MAKGQMKTNKEKKKPKADANKKKGGLPPHLQQSTLNPSPGKGAKR